MHKGQINIAHCFYFVLISAYLNPILRPSEDSNITLFRLLIPFSLFLIYACSKPIFFNMIKIILGLGALCMVQYCLNSTFFFAEIDFNIIYFLEWYFHYVCIIIVATIIISLKHIEGEHFKERFISFTILYTKIIAIFVFIYVVVLKHIWSIGDNINNIACILVSGMCFLIADSENHKKQYLWCIFILYLLLINDAKAAFFGACFVFIMYVTYKLSSQVTYSLAIRRGMIVLFILGMVSLIAWAPNINGYSFTDITVNQITRIIENRPYAVSNTSTTYRTNSTIAAIQILKRTFGLGVGFGNTSRILPVLIPNAYDGKWGSTYALHNWWLELICDFGWPMIIMQFLLFFRELMMFLYRKNRNLFESISSVYLLSFPLWSIAASRLTTEYFTLATLFFTLLISRESYKNYKKDRSNHINVES